MGPRFFITLTLLVLSSFSPLLAEVHSLTSPVTIVDMTGRKVTVPSKVKRVVCLGPGALRLVVYLQAHDKIVGVEDMEKRQNIGRPYWLAHPELHSLPTCGPGGPASINKKPDLELLLALQTELILVCYMEKELATEVQETLGIPVLALTYGDFASFDETVYEALRIVGKALHKEKRAREVIDFIEEQRKDLHERTATIQTEKKPLVYVGGIGYKGAQGLDSTDKNYVPFKWLSANHLGSKMNGPKGSHHFFDKENLLLHKPELIFIDGGGLAIIRNECNRKPEFYSALEAFKEKRVFTLWPINWYTTNIGTAIIDSYAIGQKTFPENFMDFDINDKATMILRYLVGKSVVEEMERDYGPIGRQFK